MKKERFGTLDTVDYQLANIFAARQGWQGNAQFTMSMPRPTDALLLFRDATAICKRQGEPDLAIPAGALVHIASGSVYRWCFGACEARQTTFLFEFTLHDKDGGRIATDSGVNLLCTNRYDYYEKYFETLIGEFSHLKRSPGAVKAAAYQLLSSVTRHLARENEDFVDLRVIERGIRYLREESTQEKSISEIATMCGVSINYFERLFKRYAGVTPMEYRLNRKLENATRLIVQGSMTLEQIAELLDFGDSAYLCRIFRKKIGVTPREYRRLHRFSG